MAEERYRGTVANLERPTEGLANHADVSVLHLDCMIGYQTMPIARLARFCRGQGRRNLLGVLLKQVERRKRTGRDE
jgi:hypothetical protein